jgi:uncharacterized protein YpmB
MKKRWLWGFVLGVALLLFGAYQFYTAIHAAEWSREDAAVWAAYRNTVLAKASRVESFVGDKPYYIVQGEDKLGQSVIVWVGEDEIHAEYERDGVSGDELLAAWREADPDKQLIRIRPGKIDDVYVWEIFYAKIDNGKKRYYYDYFRFSDGAPVDTYRLTLR